MGDTVQDTVDKLDTGHSGRHGSKVLSGRILENTAGDTGRQANTCQRKEKPQTTQRFLKLKPNSFLLVGNQSGRQSGKKGFKLAGGRPRAAHSGRHGGRHSGRLRANQGSKVPVCGTVRGKLGDTKETRRETKWHTGFVPRFQVGDTARQTRTHTHTAGDKLGDTAGDKVPRL